MTGAIGGVDHCIVLVRDLAAARDVWERLGFRTSPRGVHSAHMGTANHTIMLADDYIELLGTVSETAQNARWRTRLAGPGEGLVAIALRAFDAPKAAEEVAARGFPPLPVLHFGRPVALPGPGAIEATFDVFHLRDMLADELRVFFCRHNVPGATWPPGLTEHPNGAVAIESFTILAEDPRTAAEATAKLLGRTAAQADGAMVVETGRARLRFREKGTGRAGIDAIAVRVRDLEVARAALAAGGIEPARKDGSLAVPREAANGVCLSFVRA
ncbi:VOC family protein [Elioraea rosea]|uniref:VOC family protein n=1 Tax=Elioraea rosea TaxID=2492390 RepID=UPI0011839ABD|nr:VOC family protein [Elioraea rosea]